MPRRAEMVHWHTAQRGITPPEQKTNLQFATQMRFSNFVNEITRRAENSTLCVSSRKVVLVHTWLAETWSSKLYVRFALCDSIISAVERLNWCTTLHANYF